MADDIRAIRIALPLRQIRQMDRLISDGTAGFETRAEFIQEAVDNLIVELSYPSAPEEHRAGGEPQNEIIGAAAPQVAVVAQPASRGIEESALRAATVAPAVLEPGLEVEGQVLFGMHNRDYPSLWALSQLGEMTAEGPVEFDKYLTEVTGRAWDQGALLYEIGAATGGKHTALFPTNRNKVPAASGAFQLFAIGYISGEGRKSRAGGPLFEWRVATLRQDGGRILIGLTAEGARLLTALDGLTVAEPHPAMYAEAFVAHLKKFAPTDWWGFERVLSSAADGISRGDLISDFRAERPNWKESVTNTNVAGYVARCREWGLLQQKQVDGEYRTTDLGEQVLREANVR